MKTTILSAIKMFMRYVLLLAAFPATVYVALCTIATFNAQRVGTPPVLGIPLFDPTLLFTIFSLCILL